MYIYVYVLCIHIAHYIRGDRLTNCLSIVTCIQTMLAQKNFTLQFDISALPCLTAEVRQCGRHIVSIVCFTAKILVNIEILPFVHCNSTFEKKYFKNFFFLFSSIVWNVYSTFLPLEQLLYATTYHLASICWARAPSIPHTATKAIISSVRSAQ